ncbi:MAG: FAD-binding protein [Kangiellaceae bacterium]|nr:FAD-binding protein [Kangiellaceae bacterium]
MNNRLGRNNRLLASISKFLLFIAIASILAGCSILSDEKFDYKSDVLVINDVTGLNSIRVGQVITPTTIEEIITTIKRTEGPISIGGGRYSQGGQIAYLDSLHFDMRNFDKIVNFDPNKKEITVQSGITWRKIQEHIDPKDLSIKIMQTYSNFTVGGSLSVNVHGRYIGEGPVVQSVNQIKLVMADGRLVTASPVENSELFYGAIGGYGGIGVIVEATLQLADNTKVERKTKRMSIGNYKDYFFKNIRDNPDVIFTNADIYPPDYEKVLDVSWFSTDKPVTIKDRLISNDEEYKWGPKVVEFVANYPIGKSLRKNIIDPIYYSFDRIVWRNWEASYDVKELEPSDRSEKTYVLREYFIPVENFDAFIPKMRNIFQKHDANIINVSIRHAHADPGTLLSWANKEVFAFVVYYQQGTNDAAKEKVKGWSVDMIDAVISEGGTYYLPYQILASTDQFLAAYPKAPQYFALKEKVDPNYRFRNRLWKTHYPAETKDFNKNNISQYFRSEEQTLLTIPEWYLVFNPREYADFLDAGNNPSDFPFMASIDEYWRLYDRVTTISDAEGYPPNDEYMTMLNVIGGSTTVEYMIKGAYENTIGRTTRWIANGEDTPEDKVIKEAHRAYSEFIFEKAWYEFDFWGWTGKVWREPSFFGPNFIRKQERKIAFTLEFGFKTLYAKAIGFGAQAVYEESEELIYLTAKNNSFDSSLLPEKVTIIENMGNRFLISLPRWGDFTKIIPVLAEQGFDFIDISGNQRIAVSMLSPTGANINYHYASKLFSSKFVTNKNIERDVYWVGVRNLQALLVDGKNNNQTIEHIYDY